MKSLHEYALYPIEFMLNSFIKTDIAAQQTMQTMTGKTCLIFLQDLSLGISWQFVDEKLKLFWYQQPSSLTSKSNVILPDLTIRLTLKTFLLWGVYSFEELLHKGELVIDGDVEIAEKLWFMFSNAQFAWQEKVAQYFGDIAVWQLDQMKVQAQQKFTQAKEDSKKVVEQYVLDELQILATRDEIEHFNQQVTD